METVLQRLPSVFVYTDDILVTIKTIQEHLQNLKVVLTHLEKHGFRLKREKCASRVDFLGHLITAEGILPSTNKKLKAVQEAPIPKDVSQLKSFLGLLN